MQEPRGYLANVTLTSNSALYGADVATETMHLQVNTASHEGRGYQSAVKDLQNMSVYQQPFLLSVVAKDVYDQHVLSNNDDYVRLVLITIVSDIVMDCSV
jgi:hypothetical protein